MSALRPWKREVSPRPLCTCGIAVSHATRRHAIRTKPLKNKAYSRHVLGNTCGIARGKGG
jgi:hypothetical protein